jgi:hypothetical protein
VGKLEKGEGKKEKGGNYNCNMVSLSEFQAREPLTFLSF